MREWIPIIPHRILNNTEHRSYDNQDTHCIETIQILLPGNLQIVVRLRRWEYVDSVLENHSRDDEEAERDNLDSEPCDNDAVSQTGVVPSGHQASSASLDHERQDVASDEGSREPVDADQ